MEPQDWGDNGADVPLSCQYLFNLTILVVPPELHPAVEGSSGIHRGILPKQPRLLYVPSAMLDEYMLVEIQCEGLGTIATGQVKLNAHRQRLGCVTAQWQLDTPVMAVGFLGAAE